MKPHTRTEKLATFGRLLDTMDELREKCPWDKKQTFETLRILSIEEVYELADEIVKGNRAGISEEIGDILLHMTFYALLGEEEGAFDMATILEAQCDKLERRHPHIYGDVEVANEQDVKRNWEAIKLTEKGKGTVLGGVPRGLPALVKAYRMQEKTAQFGFEWETPQQVLTKVEEELEELQECLDTDQSQQRIESEYGDVLFALVNYGRFLKVDPEAALERTNQKFKRRFEYIESNAPRPLADMTLGEMDSLWEQAKGLEVE